MINIDLSKQIIIYSKIKLEISENIGFALSCESKKPHLKFEEVCVWFYSDSILRFKIRVKTV